jgi:hypothetical protein
VAWTDGADRDHQSSVAGEDAARVQAEVATLRRSVLSGRGPGSSGSEFLEHTRGRLRIGGEPIPLRRERFALDTALAARDVEGLALRVAIDRARLSTDLDAMLPRLRPAAVRRRTQKRLRTVVRVRWAWFASMFLAALLIIRSRSSR